MKVLSEINNTSYAQESVEVRGFLTHDGSNPLNALRAFDGPIGGTGMAITADLTACVAAGSTWLWDAECTTADNGLTIIRPTRQSNAVAGRWVKLIPMGASSFVSLAGDPNGVLTADVNTLCRDTGTPGRVWIKTTSGGNTGWVVVG